MKSITKIDINDKLYGGRIYENQIVDLLKEEIVFKRIFLMKYKHKLFNLPRILFYFIKYRYFFRGNLLINSSTAMFAGRKAKSNVVVIHHLENENLFAKLCNHFLFSNIKLYTKVVTVADYWKRELVYKGFKDVEVVYNAFNVDDYQITQNDIMDFKVQYGFAGKPLIYIGNARKEKGAYEVYHILKDLDINMITSGTSTISLPVPNFVFEHKDYIKMLAAADIVITMSMFREGWNRIAHEAILCETPVIGSGYGGMLELLEMADQVVCPFFPHLRDKVKNLLANKQIVNNSNVKKLDIEYFKNSWSNILLR